VLSNLILAMLTLILLLVLGSFLVYISKYNFTAVSVNLGFITFSDIPLFYVIAASLIIGLILSYLIYRVESISNFFAFRGKNKEIEKDKDEILELTKRIHQLELEKEKIKNGSEESKPTDQNAL
jgi:lipopolysaccharide assembly protein A